MSDDEIRAAERAYRASGAPQDGEAWVQAVLRTTGLPMMPLITQMIQSRRAIEALIERPEHGAGYSQTQVLVRAAYRPVTPDDIVSFLRGGREWLEPPATIFLHAAVDAPQSSIEMYRFDGVPAGSAILCNHANENPGHCPCQPDCYCRQDGHTCSDVFAVHGGSDRTCDRCDREDLAVEPRSLYYFHGINGPQGYICAEHLAAIRRNQMG